MIEAIKELFDVFIHFILQAESFYLIESSLVLFGAFLLDLFQRKTLKTFKEKAARTKTIWDDVILGAIARPISFII